MSTYKRNALTLQAAHAQPQGASPVRTGLTAITRHAAARKSRIACIQAAAQRRHVPLETLLAQAMTIGQAPRQAQKPRSREQKHCSRQPRLACSGKSTQLDMLRAARAAQLAQSRSKRASALARSRSEAAEALPAALCLQATAGPPAEMQGSRAVCAHASAHQKHAHANNSPAAASDSQQAPHQAENRMSKILSQPAMLRLATQRADLARGRAQRAHAVFQKREEPTRVSIYSAEDGPISATCSQSNQHAPLQVNPCLQSVCTCICPRCCFLRMHQQLCWHFAHRGEAGTASVCETSQVFTH